MVSAKDIATKLGVSPSAVSIAMNNKPGISDATRKMILDAANEMGYSHKKRKANSGSVIQLFVCSTFTSTVPFNKSLFLDKVIEGISLQAQQLNYTLNITYVTGDDMTSHNLSKMISDSCLGFIVLATAGEEISADALRSVGIPFVILDKPAEFMYIDSVVLANVQGITLAVDHLYSLGHRRIVHIGGSEVFSNFSERVQGYRNAVSMHPEMAGSEKNVFLLNKDNKDTPASTDYSSEFSEILDELEASPEGMPTGFVCATDWLGVSCVQALQAKGYKVPDDVSVIGFDNILVSEISFPPLTTINVPKQRMGAMAVNRLDDIIIGMAKERIKIEVLTDLVVRGSTGPAKKQ